MLGRPTVTLVATHNHLGTPLSEALDIILQRKALIEYYIQLYYNVLHSKLLIREYHKIRV